MTLQAQVTLHNCKQIHKNNVKTYINNILYKLNEFTEIYSPLYTFITGADFELPSTAI